jgi:hypothetical protein
MDVDDRASSEAETCVNAFATRPCQIQRAGDVDWTHLSTASTAKKGRHISVLANGQLGETDRDQPHVDDSLDPTVCLWITTSS